MSSLQLYPVIAGMLAAGYAVAALCFLRLWVRVRDRLFVLFALAFAILAVQRVWSAVALIWSEEAPRIYVARLVAFLLILVAIIDKNRPVRTPPGGRDTA